MVLPLDNGGGLNESDVGFEMESLDCVVEEAELEENLGSAEVMEEGVRTGRWFRTLVSTDSMEELRVLALLEDGLASLRIDFQEGVVGVDGGPLPTSPGDIVEWMTDFFRLVRNKTSQRGFSRTVPSLPRRRLKQVAASRLRTSCRPGRNGGASGVGVQRILDIAPPQVSIAYTRLR